MYVAPIYVVRVTSQIISVKLCLSYSGLFLYYKGTNQNLNYPLRSTANFNFVSSRSTTQRQQSNERTLADRWTSDYQLRILFPSAVPSRSFLLLAPLFPQSERSFRYSPPFSLRIPFLVAFSPSLPRPSSLSVKTYRYVEFMELSSCHKKSSRDVNIGGARTGAWEVDRYPLTSASPSTRFLFVSPPRSLHVRSGDIRV